MALKEDFAEGDASSSNDSNNELPLAIPQRTLECPICLDTIEDETSVSWCRHAFCFPCILEWACIRPVCPICQEPFQYLFRKVGENIYKVYYTSFSRRNRGRRDHRLSAEGRQHHSTGHWHRRGHGRRRARDWERHRSRSRRWNHDGHSRGPQDQSYDPSGSRTWQHSRALDMASETSHGWDRAARHEQDVPVHLGRSEQHQQAQWDSSRESQVRSRRTRRRSHHAWQQTQREEQRRRDCNEGQPARPEQDVPNSSGRSEHHQPAQWDSSRETRRQSLPSRRTSHSPEGHRERAGQKPRISLVCQMALQKGLAEGGTSPSTTSNNEVLQAESPHNSENQMCPICLDIINNQVSVSWCRHAFCFPCILEWSRNKPVCPICREPFRYLLRKVGDNNYEVYSIGHCTHSARRDRGRRDHRLSAEGRQHHSTGHWHRRGHGRRRARDWERHRSRSRRWNHDGHSRGPQDQSYDPSGSRTWQHSRALDMASETSHGWDRAARHEQDVPVHLGRSEQHQRAQWDSSRESWAARSRSHRSRWTSHSPERQRER